LRYLFEAVDIFASLFLWEREEGEMT